MLLRRPLLLGCYAILSGCATYPPPEAPNTSTPDSEPAPNTYSDFRRHFRFTEGTFVLFNPQTEEIVRHNPERAAQRFLPASTFKIPHTLIALETRIASGPDYSLARDPARSPQRDWWPDIWTKDHTLGSALQHSVVWFYQRLAPLIGSDRMQAYLERFDYGNKTLAGGIDRFWLDGGLRISAEEQVQFLQSFYFEELGISTRSTRILKSLLVLEETADYRLSGKTGWAGLGDPSTEDVGWFVGYLERGDDVYIFATNIDIRLRSDANRRISITKAILQDLGLMETPPRQEARITPPLSKSLILPQGWCRNVGLLFTKCRVRVAGAYELLCIAQTNQTTCRRKHRHHCARNKLPNRATNSSGYASAPCEAPSASENTASIASYGSLPTEIRINSGSIPALANSAQPSSLVTRS